MPIAKKTIDAGADRCATIKRTTKETDIQVELNLDKKAPALITTEVAFFNHMLELLARHAEITLIIKAKGDLMHHLIEDVAICLGQAFNDALGDKIGIERYGSADIPMDETLGTCAVDLSGRPYFVIDLKIKDTRIEDMATEDIIHFFESFAIHAKINLHLRVLYGENDHHKAESAFKSFAHALRKAIKVSSTEILSTKGSL